MRATSLALGTTPAGTAGTPQSYDLSGVNLTNNVIVTAPAGVELSDNSGSTWAASLTISPTGGTLTSTPVEARIAASAGVGTISSSITNASTGAATTDVTVGGDVTTAVPTIVLSKSSLNLGTTETGNPGTPAVFGVSGSDLTGSIFIVAPAGVEMSDDNGSTWNTSFTLAETAGSVPEATIETRIQSTAVVGPISGTIDLSTAGVTPPPEITVSGEVTAVAPTVTVTVTTLNLGTTVTGTAGTPQDYSVSGTNLTNNVIITAPTGVELSDNSGTSWNTTLTLSETSGTLALTTMEARIQAAASTGTISGSIANTSTGATEQDITTSGIVNPTTPTLNVSVTTLALGSTTTGTAGITQVYTIDGTTLGSNVIITAPTGVELSDNGGGTGTQPSP